MAWTNAKKALFYSLAALFVLLNGWFIYQEQMLFMGLPLVLGIALGILLALDKILLLVIFLTPLSINFEELDLGGIGFFFPTEPILFGILLLFIAKMLYRGGIDKEILNHPISVAIILNWIWILVTSFTSTMPLISLKFLVARSWFLVSAFFLMAYLLREWKNIPRILWLYLASFFLVIVLTLIEHAGHGFQEDPAHWVMNPFYKDHTSYGAVLALYFPVLLGFLFQKGRRLWERGGILILVSLMSVAIVFSYTRAAWVSLAVALFVFLILKLRIRFRTLLIAGMALAGLVFANWDRIMLNLEQNEQESSNGLSSHVASITNIANDASNLERINRWKCAWRMFEEKPVFGWGPGTYMFQYAPFQRSHDLTRIITNFGYRANAHSEYLGPLAESGFLGMISFIAIVVAICYTAVRLYKRIGEPNVRILVLSVFIGLITYFTHGFLNNFLTMDKAAIPFWSFAAILVAIDLYHRPRLTGPSD